MKVAQRRDSNGLFTETSDNDCEDDVSAESRDTGGFSLCEKGPCPSLCKQHPQTGNSLKCNECGKNRAIITRYSEGYGTEEECVLSDAQGESDADADIEDTDSRLQVAGSLQRISSRKRKRQRIARQDTTESEDDGGRNQRTHRWSLRLSPHRTHNRTILEVHSSMYLHLNAALMFTLVGYTVLLLLIASLECALIQLLVQSTIMICTLVDYHIQFMALYMALLGTAIEKVYEFAPFFLVNSVSCPQESISQVRPLVISRCNAVEPPAGSNNEPQRGTQSLQVWPFTLSLPLFFILIILPLTISIIIVLFVFPLSLTNT